MQRHVCAVFDTIARRLRRNKLFHPGLRDTFMKKIGRK